MKGLISIAMPVYNCSDYIEDCINSILIQTHSNWELLIVDDCSTDNTVNLISTFSDKRIKLMRNQCNIGLAASLNKCIDLSVGEYIARMDGDDIMIINRLEVQYNYLIQNANVDVIGGLAYLIGANNEILGYKKCLAPQNFKQLLLDQGFFIHPSVMGRKHWFEKFKYDPNLKRGQDLELWIRSYNSSNFMNLSHYLIFYREVESEYKEKYLRVYLALKNILKLHKKIIPFHIRLLIMVKSILKYVFFDIFKFVGFIHKKQKLTSSELIDIQIELNKVIR